MCGRFPLDMVPASSEQLAEIGYGVKAHHPGGDAYLEQLDAAIEATDLALRRQEKIRRVTDAVVDPLFFWPLCAAICQFTINLFS